jgi:hypothetical protein
MNNFNYNPIYQLRNLRIVLSFFVLSIGANLSAQQKQESMPTVFFIGEHQDQYDVLISKHSELLITVCNSSMDKAFDHWVKLMSDLEAHMDKNGFNIKGAKIWANVFWDTNGKISHFAFYPKPNSKNIDYERMKILVAEFLKTYRGTLISSSKPYSHYGTATFPIYARLVEKN